MARDTDAADQREVQRHSSERAAGFRSLLDSNPEVADAVRDRMEAFPEYAAWLQQFGAGVISALKT